MSDNNIEKTKELISFGSEIAGATAGGVIGFLAAGPAGAIAGSVVGPFLAKGLELAGDFALRDLSEREKIKTGAGLAFAYAKIIQYLDDGFTPRQDDFFEDAFGGRSVGDEILEGVLFKCKNEHEEKKLQYIGNIYANVAFMSEAKVAGANWMLQQAQNLTYRQLCIIALIQQKQNKGVSWGPGDGDPAFQIEYEGIDLMLARDHSPDSVRSFDETGEGLWVIGLSRIGEFCYDLMSLKEIPEHDLKQLEAHFPHSFSSK